MTKTSVEVTGMGELLTKMQAFPVKLGQVMAKGMAASLTVIWEKIPPYPAPPADSSYRRTGTLGRTLGSSMRGSTSGGNPDIFTVKKLGAGYEGRFGTRLNYAPYVIGDGTQSRAHAGRWWTLRNVAEKAQSKILQVWTGIADKLAAYLEGKGLL